MTTHTVDATLPVQEKYRAITAMLKETQKANIQFRKKDGELRNMLCTLDSSLMPVQESAKYQKTLAINFETIVVWCIDKAAWRAFKTENFISLTSAE